MKKIVMMAMLLVASATAFAGDSDALKAIMKAKTYAEAETLLNSSLSQLANAAEKAKAYNKLVDLAMADYKVQADIQMENQVAKQMGKEEKPVDVKAMSDALVLALAAANECDKYDQQPNEKGKVAPKFAKANVDRLWNYRVNLVNPGQDAARDEDYATALKYWGAFVESDEYPLFKDCDRTQQKEFFGQVARFAGIYAYQAKDMDRAIRYAEIAMKDPQEAKDALNLKLEAMRSGLQTREDSVKFVAQIKDIYAQNPDNDVLLENIYNIYNALGQKEDALAVLDETLARNPENFVALADKGMAAMADSKTDEAVEWLRKAAQVRSDNPVIMTYLGTGLCMKAQDTEDAAAKKTLYQEAVEVFDKAKELDPDKLQTNWGYNRFNAYYNLYGEDDPRTKQAEADYKN